MQFSFEVYRPYLYILAEAGLDRSLRSKLDADDLVQEALRRAILGTQQIREPNNELVVRSWLKTILGHVIADERKKFRGDKRNVDIEVSIAADVEQSAAGLEHWLASQVTPPCGKAERNEEIERLAKALKKLTVEIREVIVLRYIGKAKVAEIAGQTGRTVPAVAGLLRRGMAKLREELK